MVLFGAQLARIVKRMGGFTVLAEVEYAWELDEPHQVTIEVEGSRINGWIDGKQMVSARDNSLPTGGFGFLCEEGLISSDQISIAPKVALLPGEVDRVQLPGPAGALHDELH